MPPQHDNRKLIERQQQWPRLLSAGVVQIRFFRI
jgi:hypothetical protein